MRTISILLLLVGVAAGVAAAENAATKPASAAADTVAEWDAKADQAITIEGVAYHEKGGSIYLKPTGNAYPYSIQLLNVLDDLKAGQLLPVRVTGTLHLLKRTLTQTDIDSYKRALAESKGQMKLQNLKVGDISRTFWISEVEVTRLPPATAPAK